MTPPRIPRATVATCWLCFALGVALWCLIGWLGWWFVT